jgi:hypothetical protein
MWMPSAFEVHKFSPARNHSMLEVGWRWTAVDKAPCLAVDGREVDMVQGVARDSLCRQQLAKLLISIHGQCIWTLAFMCLADDGALQVKSKVKVHVANMHIHGQPVVVQAHAMCHVLIGYASEWHILCASEWHILYLKERAEAKAP